MSTENNSPPVEQRLINETIAMNPPRTTDVIRGRGNGPNTHSGNVAFRKLVAARRDEYLASSEFRKRHIVREVIDLVHNSDPPGRFLTAEDLGVWKLMEYKSILRKVAQALRDRDMRPEKKSAVEPATGLATEPATDGNDMMNDTTPPRSPKLGGSVKRVWDATNESTQAIPSLGGDVSLQTSPAVHKLPRLGVDDSLHKNTNGSDMVIVIQKEIAMIREQVAQLNKRVTTVEERYNSIGLN